ncbi:uncharacterized protein LOC134240715 [Saccostrea cucullata]|uniref:uncharacterized protein LOC134240715 n=1 Tax=Saccostrea cuccullata TaxID=36930 RepID=UPI002ED15F79
MAQKAFTILEGEEWAVKLSGEDSQLVLVVRWEDYKDQTSIFVVVKYETCPYPYEVDSKQIGPYCSNDDGCHGSQKCCPNYVYGGNRCQIPREYQRYGSCNSNFVDLPFHPTRRACNDDTICPHVGKCCRRRSSRQIDTCTYPSVPYRLGLGGVGGPYSPVGGESFGPVGGGSYGPVGGPGVGSPLLLLLPHESYKKKY